MKYYLASETLGANTEYANAVAMQEADYGKFLKIIEKESITKAEWDSLSEVEKDQVYNYANVNPNSPLTKSLLSFEWGSYNPPSDTTPTQIPDYSSVYKSQEYGTLPVTSATPKSVKYPVVPTIDTNLKLSQEWYAIVGIGVIVIGFLFGPYLLAKITPKGKRGRGRR